MEEGRVTPGDLKAQGEGKKAARKGQKYDENPYEKGSSRHLQWSKGHNAARASMLKKEEVELEEGRNEVLKALEKLAKSGGIDKEDFQKAHDLYKANKLMDLRKHIHRLDTDPSEAIASVIDRHDSKAFNSMYPRAKSGDNLRKIVSDHGGK